MTRRQRRWLAAGAVTVGAIVATEIALRMLFGLGTPLLLQADPDVGYFHRANQSIRRFGRRIQINAHHQRNGPVTPTPAPGSIRVLMVGDSVTSGGMPTDQAETITARLAVELGAAGREASVLNASAGSWSIGNALAYLEKFGTFGSHVVVLQVGTQEFTQPKSSAANRVGVKPNMPDRNPRSAITELIGRYGLPRLLPAGDEVRPATDPATVFDRNLGDLETAVRRCRDAGARVIVLHTPYRDEVVAGPGGGYVTSAARRRADFLARCAALDVGVVDLVEAWRGDADTPARFRDGVHFTPRGNAAAARALAPPVVERAP